MTRPQQSSRPQTARPSIWPASLPALAILAAALCALLAAPYGVRAAPESPTGDPLEELTGRFAAMPGLSARFREEKHLALLRSPLVSEGTLHFAPPGSLLRRVESPIASSVLIRDGRLSYASERSQGSIDLDANPAVRVFVDSFRLLLAGDLAALRALYRVELLAWDPEPEGAWALSLEPLDPALRSALQSIELRGSGKTLAELRIREAGGDLSVTTFFAVDSERDFSGAERDALFRLPTS